MMEWAILFGSIEAGGTKFVCAVGNDQGQIIKRVSFPTTTPSETMQQVFDFFDPDHLKAIGIGSFGPIDVNPNSQTYGYIKNTPKPSWANYNFVGAIKSRFEIPVGWSTDVNAAALSEAMKGAGAGLQSVLYLTVGTGIGGGAVIDGKILEGFSHPEMGHIKVQPHPKDSFQGLCPFHHNCLEGMAAGPTIEARLKQKGNEIDRNHEVWGFLAHYLAQALYTYTFVLSPDIIILGGGVMKSGHLLPKVKIELVELIANYVEIPPIDNYIRLPALGDDSGIIGGLLLAKKEYDKVG
jgi:fructokinase